MIIEVVGKEIEKIKGDYESYLNGLNMVGEISYSQYSELYDEGTKQIQKAYELGKAEKNAELENKIADIKANCDLAIEGRDVKVMELEKENERLTVSYETLKLHDEEEIGMLKSENAELKKKCYKKAVKDYCKLEKENAELKEQLESERDLPVIAYMQGAEKQKKKDEEMAKQFADNISGLELTCSLLSAKDKRHAYRLGRYDGFLAGLKAGRSQWHDLRKDPNDLPKEDCEVFAYYEKGSLCGKAKLQKYKKGVLWVDSGEISLWVDNLGYQIRNVLAWCEIPTFDKE